jgi:cation diffusion facilitator family transporter
MINVKKAKFITVISAISNGIMAIIKMLVGYFGHSKSLFVDGIHSILDLFTDLFVYWGAHIGSLPPDESHPYGHQRIETMVMLFMSLLIIIVGILFAYEGIKHLFEDNHEISLYVLVVAFISIIVNELLYRITVMIGKEIHSSLIISNAYHHRSDSLSSLVVLVGAFGTYNNISWLDSLAAVIVSCMIIKLGLKLIIEGTNELVDSAVDAETRKKIISVIMSHPEIVNIDSLKTRMMAKRILIDAAVTLSNNVSLSEAELIRTQITKKLKKTNHLIINVSITMMNKANLTLPSHVPMDFRSQIIQHIEATHKLKLKDYNLLMDVEDNTFKISLVKKSIYKDITISSPFKKLKKEIHIKIFDS